MSLRHHAASLLVDAVAAGLAPGQRWLVIDDADQDLPIYLRQRGREVTLWHRWAGHGVTASAEPPAGSYDAVALRLPRGREPLSYALHLAASRLAPGAPLWLYGANDEGIKSAGKRLEPLFEDVRAVDSKRHCRLWTAARSEAVALGSLAAHAREVALTLPLGEVTLTAYPGVFAKGKLDPGSRLLVEALATLELQPRRALDFACGLGVLGLAATQRWPGLKLWACDADALAVAAAKENLPGAQVVAASGLEAFEVLPSADYELVLSNPPIHVEDTINLDLVEGLIRRLPKLLAPGGAAVIVVQRQRPVHRIIEEVLGRPKLLAEDSHFRVWLARR